eukprot:g25440.t1
MISLLVLTLAWLGRPTAANNPQPCTCPPRCRNCNAACNYCGPDNDWEAASHCEPGYYGDTISWPPQMQLRSVRLGPSAAVVLTRALIPVQMAALATDFAMGTIYRRIKTPQASVGQAAMGILVNTIAHATAPVVHASLQAILSISDAGGAAGRNALGIPRFPQMQLRSVRLGPSAGVVLTRALIPVQMAALATDFAMGTICRRIKTPQASVGQAAMGILVNTIAHATAPVVHASLQAILSISDAGGAAGRNALGIPRFPQMQLRSVRLGPSAGVVLTRALIPVQMAALATDFAMGTICRRIKTPQASVDQAAMGILVNTIAHPTAPVVHASLQAILSISDAGGAAGRNALGIPRFPQIKQLTVLLGSATAPAELTAPQVVQSTVPATEIAQGISKPKPKKLRRIASLISGEVGVGYGQGYLVCVGYETSAASFIGSDSRCNPGYYGSTCANPCSENCATGCTSSGYCVGYDSQSARETSAHCKRGYSGEYCQFKCPANCAKGTCVTSNNLNLDLNQCSGYAALANTDAAAQCNPGFYGSNCAYPCSETCASDCTNSGYCVGYHSESARKTSIHCKTGYSGFSCQFVCPPNCASGTCTTSFYNNNLNQCSGYDALAHTDAATHCISGFYGSDCSSPCYETCATRCARDGYCAGYHLQSAREASSHCQMGYYGYSCQLKCPANCATGTCVTPQNNDINAPKICSGYAALSATGAATHCIRGFYGSDCSIACSFCATGCARDGYCAGYHLESAREASSHCQMGYYGYSCQLKCSANCATGTCVTPQNNDINAPKICSGYAALPSTGAATHCISGFYGSDCSSPCYETCATRCARDGYCAGYHLQSAREASSHCQMGYYGYSCQLKCSANCATGTCVTPQNNDINAPKICSGYAALPATGAATHCISGFYGSDCSSPCYETCATRCARDGYCAGYHLQSAREASSHCQMGYYGYSCQLKCSANCATGTCVTPQNNDINAPKICSGYAALPATGAATHCISGFYGSDCSSPCYETCATRCARDGYCAGYHLQSARENSSHCQMGYYGYSCQLKCPANCATGTCVTPQNNDINAPKICSGYAALPSTGAATHCIRGFYGSDCSIACSVAACATGCARDNGYCAGYHLESARENSSHCQRGYSGCSCQFKCRATCASGTCATYSDCNYNWDRCSGYTALTSMDASTQCIPGFYGPGCQSLCPKHCALFRCTKEGKCIGYHLPSSGETSSHCEKGYFGEACQYECPLHCAQGTCALAGCSGRSALSSTDQAFHCVSGFWGTSCAYQCPSSCSQISCAVSGKCLGYHLAAIDDGSPHCLSGYCGDSCDFSCPINCAQGTCGFRSTDRSSGSRVCSGYTKLTDADSAKHCKLGFYGPTCSQVCPTHCARPGCTAINGYCLGHEIFDRPDTIACHCKDGVYGKFCDTACPAPCRKCSGNARCRPETNLRKWCANGYCLPESSLQQCACCQNAEPDPCGSCKEDCRNGKCVSRSCGNGVVDSAEEQCDGVDTNGHTCASYGMLGDLGCDQNCKLDFRQCHGDQKSLISCEKKCKAQWEKDLLTGSVEAAMEPLCRDSLTKKVCEILIPLIPEYYDFSRSLSEGLQVISDVDADQALRRGLPLPSRVDPRSILLLLRRIKRLQTFFFEYAFETSVGLIKNAAKAYWKMIMCEAVCYAAFGARRRLVGDMAHTEAARYTDRSVQAMMLELEAQKFFAQLLGDDCWLWVDDGRWNDLFMLATDSNSSEGSRVSSAELRNLTERLPQSFPGFPNITYAQVVRFVQRQNNLVGYKENSERMRGRKCPNLNCPDIGELAQKRADFENRYRNYCTQFSTNSTCATELQDWKREFISDYYEDMELAAAAVDNSTCVPWCSSRGQQCGYDGCGGTCGSCHHPLGCNGSDCVERICAGMQNMTTDGEGVEVVVERYQDNLNCSWRLSPSNKSSTMRFQFELSAALESWDRIEVWTIVEQVDGSVKVEVRFTSDESISGDFSFSFASVAPSVSVSVSNSPTISALPSASESLSPTASASVSALPSASESLWPTASASVSALPSASESLSPTASASVSALPSASESLSPIASASVSALPSASESLSPTASASVSASPSSSFYSFSVTTPESVPPSVSSSPSVWFSLSASFSVFSSVSFSSPVSSSSSVSLSPALLLLPSVWPLLSVSSSLSTSLSDSVSPSVSLLRSVSPSFSVSMSTSPLPLESILSSLSPSVTPWLHASESFSSLSSESMSPSPLLSLFPSVSPSVSVSESLLLLRSVSLTLSPSLAESVSFSPSLSPFLSSTSPSSSVSEWFSNVSSASLSPAAAASPSISFSPSASASSYSLLSSSVSSSLSTSLSNSALPSVSPSVSLLPSISLSV